jgi:hypothetical protein
VLGYAADGIVSPRDVLAGIEDAYQFDAFESGEKIVFSSRANVRTLAIGSDDIAIEDAGDVGYSLTRAQETDLPGSLRLSFLDAYAAYTTGSASARKAVGNSDNVAQFSVAAVLEPALASATAQMLLQQAWAARESGEVKLPPSRIAIDTGDCIKLTVDGVTLPMRVRSIDSGVLHKATLAGFDPSLARAAAIVGDPPRRAFALSYSNPFTSTGKLSSTVIVTATSNGEDQSTCSMNSTPPGSPSKWSCLCGDILLTHISASPSQYLKF